MNSINAKTVVSRLDRIFALFGIPSVARTDNGPPFNSELFKNFANQLGFKHRRITPVHPQANSYVERFMSPLQKAIKTAVAEGQNYKEEIYKFLRNYRACPHPSTGLCPSEVMFNRKIKTVLPQFTVPQNDKFVRERDTKIKLKNKQYADKKRKARPSNLKSGDAVLVRQPKKNKLTTPFNPNPGVIIEKKGSMVTVKHGDRTLTRDASHFKPIPRKIVPTDNLPRTAVYTPTQPRISLRHKKKPTKFKDYEV